MKKVICILILTFMLGGMLTGCSLLTDSDDYIPEKENNTDISTPDDGSHNNEENTDLPDNQTGGEVADAPNEEGGNGSEDQTEVTPLPEIGTAVGDRFKDVTLERIGGGTVNTADYRGKIVVINSWATWCPPCKAELPDFSKIASEYADRVVIIAAHVPSESHTAADYIRENLPDSKIIFTYDEGYEAYLAAGGSQYIPQTAVIDGNGVILYSDSGMLSYDDLVSIIESN